MAAVHERRETIKDDVPASQVVGLTQFIDMYFTSPKLRLVSGNSYKKTISDDETTFSWLQLANDRQTTISVALTISKSVEVNFDYDPDNQVQLELYKRTLDQARNLVYTYFQNVKTSTIYFVIGSQSENNSEAPSNPKTTQKIARRIFSGNTTNVFLLFLVLGYAVFLFVGSLVVVVIVALQLVYLYYSDVISLNLGNVRPTSEAPLAAVVGVKSNSETTDFLRSRGRHILSEIRKEASGLVLKAVDTTPGAIDKDVKKPLLEIFSRNGVNTSSDQIEVKTKDVYNVVSKVSSKFGRPVPKIVIGNSPISNAMATGISPKRSSIMITAGSLVDLSDDELSSVIGHELGHVKGHDPIILFGITSLVYIGAFYLWYPLLLFLGLFYYVIAFGFIFAVGKILETRADTESAAVLGNASELATSLTKIGFRRFYLEKYSELGRLLDWFSFDPHPPIYFRVARLSSLAGREQSINHTFLISLRDCIKGFFSSF